MARLLRTSLIVAACLAVLACGDQGPDDYSLEIEQRFLDQCAAAADRDECRCLYRRISETVPFERFEEMDRQLDESGGEIPPEIEELAVECAASLTDAGERPG